LRANEFIIKVFVVGAAALLQRIVEEACGTITTASPGQPTSERLGPGDCRLDLRQEFFGLQLDLLVLKTADMLFNV
jgi:hypothetical protein